MSRSRIENVRSTAELPQSEQGILLNGLIVRIVVFDHVYCGTRDALILAGIAKAEWFPLSPQPGKKPGSTKRVFQITDEITLVDLGRNDRWELTVPILGGDELAQRHAEVEASREKFQRMWWGGERKGRLGSQGVKEQPAQGQPLKLAPPVVPGSLTEREKHHIRVLRTLREGQRAIVLEVGEAYLPRHLKFDEPDVVPEVDRPHLRLVVDHDQRCEPQ